MLTYERIKMLCKEKGVTVTGTEKGLGFARGSLCKVNTNKPSMEKVQKLANYFDVSVEFLINGKEKSVEEEPHYYFNEDARDLALFMFENPEYKVLFDASRKVKKEDIEFVKQMIDRIRGDNDDTGC